MLWSMKVAHLQQPGHTNELEGPNRCPQDGRPDVVPAGVRSYQCRLQTDIVKVRRLSPPVSRWQKHVHCADSACDKDLQTASGKR